MGVERIRGLFEPGRSSGHGALLPYLTLGFPDLGVTEALIRRCDALGVRVIEIGIPYSDSIADGPMIQSSFNAALEAGVRPSDAFDLIARVRSDVSCALVAMVSFTVVHRVGVERFLKRAAASGFDGVILPDLPLEEAAPVRAHVEREGLAMIGLVAPTTSDLRKREIAGMSSGFVYQIAHAGLTGERTGVNKRLAEDVLSLKASSGLPVCVGFGVSTPDHVREVCSFADGAIVGSAIVRRLTEGVETGLSRDELVAHVGGFVAELVEGTRPRP